MWSSGRTRSVADSYRLPYKYGWDDAAAPRYLCDEYCATPRASDGPVGLWLAVRWALGRLVVDRVLDRPARKSPTPVPK